MQSREASPFDRSIDVQVSRLRHRLGRRRQGARDHQDGARRGLRARGARSRSRSDALLPRSLFSRMVLVLLGGLVVAQLSSFAIHMHERGELLLSRERHAVGAAHRGHRQAARFAVPGRSGADRRAVSTRRRCSVSHGRGRRSPRAGPRSGERRTGRVASDDAAPLSRRRSAAGRGHRRPRPPSARRRVPRTCTGRWPARRWEARCRRPGDARLHGAMAAGGISFVAQVRLTDGTLVTFDSRQPAGHRELAVPAAAEPRRAARWRWSRSRWSRCAG